MSLNTAFASELDSRIECAHELRVASRCDCSLRREQTDAPVAGRLDCGVRLRRDHAHDGDVEILL